MLLWLSVASNWRSISNRLRNCRTAQVRGHDFQGYRLFKLAIRTLSTINRAHAPASEQFHGPIRTELSGGNGQRWGRRNRHGIAHFEFASNKDATSRSSSASPWQRAWSQTKRSSPLGNERAS